MSGDRSALADGQKSFPKTFVIKGPLVHSEHMEDVTILEHHFIVVKDGKISMMGPENMLNKCLGDQHIPNNAVFQLQDGEFLIPGFIDTHIHAPQFPNAGLGLDKTLLEWLKTYTFPLEAKYSDVEFAKSVYETVVRQTLSSGTTTACYFATIHLQSSVILADVVHKLGQRAFVGKVCMNTNSPANYCEKTKESIDSTEMFIKQILSKNYKLVQPIVTPRFAISCDMELMTSLGELAEKYKMHIQTHVSENDDEVKTVANMFPQDSYVQVYDAAKLLTPKTVLAHGVFLTDSELPLLVQRGTSIAHCPVSNTSLRSGACNVRRLLAANVKVGLGSDVSGGYTAAMLQVIRSAIDVSIQISFSKAMQQNIDEYQPLKYSEAFYLATMGGARALGLDCVVGNFQIGKEFDALVINMKTPDSPVNLLTTYNTRTLFEKFIYTADDRNISKVFVAGTLVKGTANS